MDANRPDSPMGMATFTMTPATQNFGDAVLGSVSMATTFTVTNTGTAASSAVSVALSGTNASDFAIGANTCAGMTLAPMATCTVSVTFGPGGTMRHMSNATLTAMAGTATASSALMGNAVPDVGFTVTPSPYNFGTTPVGTPTASHSFTVMNTGGVASGTLSINLSGLDSTQFSVGTDGCTGMTLAAGASCTVDVTYSPSSMGDHAATLAVTASPGGTANAALTGRAVIPAAITLLPATRNFGNVVTGAMSTTVDFTLRNTGGVATSNVTMALGGADASEFSIVSDLCSGAPLNGGATCVVSVQFTAGTPAMKSATLTATAGTLTAMSTLTATSVPMGAITINPTSHDFGSSTIGTATGGTTFTITNTGGSAIGPMVVGVAGTNPTDFPIGSNTCSGAMLAAGASCTVAVSFNPSAVGARQGTLTANGAGATGSGSADLTGNGDTAALIQVTPAAANFGSVATGTTLDLPFTVTNAGTAPTGAITAVLTGLGATQFSIVSVGTCSAPLAGGATCTITVRFAPTAVGSVTAVLDVSSPTGGRDTADLGGMGITPAALTFSAGNPVTFGSVAETDTPTRTVTVSNTGAATVNTLTVALSGADASAFTILPASTCGATLAGGSSCNVVIQFNAHAQRAYAANLDVSGTPGGMITAPISATGIADLNITCTGGLGFGNVTINGGAIVRQCNVANASARALTLSALPTVTGADFTYTAGGTAPVCTASSALAVGASCNFRVTLTPTGTQGARSGMVTVSATPGGATDTVTLTATAQAPLRFLDWRVGTAGVRTAFAGTPPMAGTADFGNRNIGGVYDMELRAQNFSAASVTVPQTSSMFTGDLNISSPTPPPAVLADSCTGATVTAGNTCSVWVRFYPRTAAASTGTVTLTTTGANTTIANITAMGQVGASIGVTGSGNFGTVIATQTVDRTFTVTNASPTVATANVTFAITSGGTRYAIVPTGSAGAGTCNTTTPAPLAASASCTVVVRFSPIQADSTTSAIVGNLRVTQGAQSVDTALTGNVSSQLTLTPATAAFAAGVGSTSAPQTFTVTNVGSTATGNIFVSIGSFASEFPISANTCTTLAVGGTCTFAVSFSPVSNTDRAGIQVQVSNGVFAAGSARGTTSTVSGDARSLANLVLNPNFSPFQYGDVAEGTNGPSYTFTLTNTGDLPSGNLSTSIVPAAIAGCGGAGPWNTTNFWTITATTCTGTLAAGASCTVAIRHNPPAGSACGFYVQRQAQWRVTDGTTTFTTTIQGFSNIASAAFFSPSTDDFGSVVIGSSSTPHTITVSNGGAVPLRINNTLTSANGYNISSMMCPAGTVLPAGGVCTFVVTYSPVGAPGFNQTIFDINATPMGMGAIDMLYSANGTALAAAALAMSAPSNFGNVISGQTATQTITVSNTGGVPTSAAPSIAISGADPSQFMITNNLCTAVLAPASAGPTSRCTFDLVFAPTGAGVRNATVTATAGATNASRATTGTGIANALLGISPSAPVTCTDPGYAAGSFACGTTFTISNGGGSSTVVSASVTNDFTVDPASTCVTSPTLNVGATCTVLVRHAPSDVGADAGVLTVSGSTGVTPVTANVSATGVSALTLTAGSPNFGSAAVNALAAAMPTFVFTNQNAPTTGLLTWAISGTNGGDFDVMADTCTGATLAGGGTCSIQVRFIPTATGARAGTLTVTDGTGNKTAVVSMTGTGT